MSEDIDKKKANTAPLGEESKKITSKFIKTEDHKNIMVNRFWGGFQRGGLFQMHLLLDAPEAPKEITEELTVEGSEITNRKPEEDKMVGRNQATVYMSIQTLLSLHNWLDDKIKKLEEQGMIKDE